MCQSAFIIPNVPQLKILFKSSLFLRSARVSVSYTLYVFLPPVRGAAARTGLFRAFNLFMDG
jgi:hypothetical protein